VTAEKENRIIVADPKDSHFIAITLTHALLPKTVSEATIFFIKSPHRAIVSRMLPQAAGQIRK